jgi:1-acyl-sn-glycerol-3-phosphate acyltransferase
MSELFTVATIIIIIALLWLLIRFFRAVAAAQKTDWGKTWLNYLDGLIYLFCKYYHRLEYTPIDLPAQGAAIVVANHLSGLDGLLLIATTRRPLRFLIAREEYERFGLMQLFRAAGSIPVDRSHRPEIALRAALRALEAGEVIALFPQGRMILPGETRKLKRGAFWLAQQTNSPIYPAFMSGIAGVGYIFRGILWRSHAKLVSYPPLDWRDKNNVEYLQTLFEGKLEKGDE